MRTLIKQARKEKDPIEREKKYNEALGDKSKLDIIGASQKAGKALVPAWIVNDWLKTYKMEL